MLNPFMYGLSDQHLGMGGLKGPPRFMAVLGTNKAYQCYYQVIGISRGLSVTIKTKTLDHILKID